MAHKTASPDPAEEHAEPNSVFLVRGRDQLANDAMREFLSAVGISIIEWNYARSKTKGGTPYIGEILDTGFRIAKATLVLLTPDEIVFLRHCFKKPEDNEDTAGPTTQSRPNVLYELGWAMKAHPERTIIVKIGPVRLPSDVIGRHYIEFDNTEESRRALCAALKKKEVGLEVRDKGPEWRIAGSEDFEAVLKREHRPKHEWIPAGRDVKHSAYKFLDVLDENCQNIIMTAMNFADLFGDPVKGPSWFHHLLVSTLRTAGKPVIELYFAPHKFLKAEHHIAYLDLKKKAIPQMLRLLDSSGLTPDERNRLLIYSHPGALSMQAFVRDPEDEKRGLFVATPRWLTDKNAGNRMYFAVHCADNSDLFYALWNSMSSDLRANQHRKTLHEVAQELGISS